MTTATDTERLRHRAAPIDIGAAGFREAGHALVDRIADWLVQLPSGPVVHDETPSDVRQALHAAEPYRHRD